MAEAGAQAREEVPVTPEPQQPEEDQAVSDRRVLRSQYHAVKSLISGRAPSSRAKSASLVFFLSRFSCWADFDLGVFFFSF